MKQLTSISGIVDNANTLTSTHGTVINGRGTVSTSHKTSFRIDGNPIIFCGYINISDGDKITAVGEHSSNGLSALAISNHSTNTTYRRKIFPDIAVIIFSSIWFILLGLALFGIFRIRSWFRVEAFWILFIIGLIIDILCIYGVKVGFTNMALTTSAMKQVNQND